MTDLDKMKKETLAAMMSVIGKLANKMRDKQAVCYKDLRVKVEDDRLIY